MPEDATFTKYYAVSAEGHRIGLATCRLCGTTVILGDPEADWDTVHARWHQTQQNQHVEEENA